MNVGKWMLMGLGTTGAVAILLWILARAPAPRRAPLRISYLLAWIIPNLIYVLAFHSPKPGYLLLTLPPMFLLAGALVDGRLPAPNRLAPFAGAVVVGTSLWLGSISYEDDAYLRSSLASVRMADADTAALIELAKGGRSRHRAFSSCDRIG